MKPILNFPWSLLVVKLRIPGLTRRGAAYCSQNIALPSDTPWTTSELPCLPEASNPFFFTPIAGLETKNVSHFSLFTVWYGFGNCNLISWILNSISSKINGPISVLFLGRWCTTHMHAPVLQAYLLHACHTRTNTRARCCEKMCVACTCTRSRVYARYDLLTCKN